MTEALLKTHCLNYSVWNVVLTSMAPCVITMHWDNCTGGLAQQSNTVMATEFGIKMARCTGNMAQQLNTRMAIGFGIKTGNGIESMGQLLKLMAAGLGISTAKR